jgi:large subunit ribosomal protein L15
VSRDISIVNVGELDELAPYLVEEGLAEVKDGAYHINLENLGIEKVLGSGRVTRNLIITSENFSESAREKIKNAGGSCIDAE